MAFRHEPDFSIFLTSRFSLQKDCDVLKLEKDSTSLIPDFLARLYKVSDLLKSGSKVLCHSFSYDCVLQAI